MKKRLMKPGNFKGKKILNLRIDFLSVISLKQKIYVFKKNLKLFNLIPYY